jgi:hypothetical protein
MFTTFKNIKIGDTSAKIQLTSGQDFVMINSIVTKLNSQLPDATIRINSLDRTCDSRKLLINYTVFNRNSTNSIAAGMPIAVHNGSLLSTSKTTTSLPIDGSETAALLQIPENIVSPFEVKLIVDDDGTGTGIITELNENYNNSDTISNVVKEFPKN